jgi:hypothetical protein
VAGFSAVPLLAGLLAVVLLTLVPIILLAVPRLGRAY